MNCPVVIDHVIIIFKYLALAWIAVNLTNLCFCVTQNLIKSYLSTIFCYITKSRLSCESQLSYGDVYKVYGCCMHWPERVTGTVSPPFGMRKLFRVQSPWANKNEAFLCLMPALPTSEIIRWLYLA